MNGSELCDKAIDIIKATDDGDRLDPRHLKLVEMAVNGELSERGIETFNELHKTVITTGYVKPFFHGIEHLTIDNEGFVYWKGKEVEHYNLSWAYSDEAKKQAIELARRCKIIEERGEIPSTLNAVWKWEE
jgi:hypothetical protein